MESTNSKRMKTGEGFPKVFKGPLSSCRCATWNLYDWSKACGDFEFKFRTASKKIKKKPRWENESKSVSATVQQFTDFISVDKKQNVGKDVLGMKNPFHEVDLDSEWIYTSYNYMSDVFKDSPEMYDVIDWGMFGLENHNGKDSTLWIGTSGSQTPCHQDSYGENLVAQLYGRKLWILFPPEETCNMYPTRIPYEESSVFSSVTVLNPDYRRFPKFSAAKMFAIVLEPGDVLYVPPKWWHYVHCIDTAISVNTWVETKRDGFHRLEEAVVRMLMTALLPTYQPQKENWLNQNEELMPASDTINILSTVAKSVLHKEQECVSYMIDFNKRELCTFCSISVAEISYKDLQQLLAKLGILPFIEQTNENLYECNQNNDDYEIVQDVLNCFLHPKIVEIVAKEIGNFQ